MVPIPAVLRQLGYDFLHLSPVLYTVVSALIERPGAVASLEMTAEDTFTNAMSKNKLIIFAGLPGTGKTRIAEGLARQFAIPVFAKDWLESALLRSGFNAAVDREKLGYAGYELLTTLLTRQLSLGQSAIVDSVASVPRLRRRWAELAQQYNANFLVIECVCSDEAVHRARLEQRQRGIPGWSELSWEDVLRAKSYYPAWQQERLILDAVEDFETNFAEALRYVMSERGQG